MPIPGSSVYPGALDTNLSMFGYQSNQTEFTLATDITALDTQIPVNESPATLSFPQLFVFTDDGEIIYTTGSTSGSFTNLIIERFTGNTHTSGCSLRMVMFAEYLNQLRRGIFAIEGELGVTPSGSSDTVATRLTSIESNATETSASVTTIKTRDFAVNVSIGDGSTAITGSKVYIWVRMPYSGSITSWDMSGQTSGSISVDIWKSSYVDMPATVADTVCGGNYISMSGSSTKNTNSTLTGWTKTFDKGDWLTFYTNETPAPTATQVTIALIGKVIDEV